MEFFSWKTADSKESIANVHSGREVKPVYLLQPNGKPPIEEKAYEGLGVFGGVDVYKWLAEVNFGDGTLITAAIHADCGHYFEDDEFIYLCAIHLRADEFKKVMPDVTKPIAMFDHYEAELANGMTPNQCIEKGLWEVKTITLTYPIKLSFDPHAIYEDCPASQPCDYHGFFYPEDGDE